MIELLKDKVEKIKEVHRPYHSYLIGFFICLGNGWWIFTKEKQNFHVWASVFLALVFFSLFAWSFYEFKKSGKLKEKNVEKSFDFDVFKK